MTTPPRILTWSAGVVFFVVSWQAYALPIVGLTQLRSVEDESARIVVIDDTGYISTRDGIQPINQEGLLPLVTPLAPTFGPLFGTTRVVANETGRLFYGAKFDKRDIFFGRRGGFYWLDDPSTLALTWPGGHDVAGFDSSLQGYTTSSVLLPDGSEIPSIPFIFTPPPGIDNFFAGDVTPNGYVLGDVSLTGTFGSGPAFRNPDTTVILLDTSGVATSIRDRLDGDGVNVGYVSPYATVRSGSRPIVEIDGSIGQCCDSNSVIVSESDFTVVNLQHPRRQAVYYPDVNPAGADLSVPLLDVSPELQSLDFDVVIDATSAGGQIHLLLSGDDGLWLFAAPDPSVVPEPAMVTLLGILAGILVLRRRRQRQIGAA